MRLNEYQVEAFKTAVYPHHGEQELPGVLYAILGLAGEAGETANKIKKVIRDDGGVLSVYNKHAVKEELSDCLWYLAALATELDFTLDEIAEANLAKLKSRQQREVLGGNGDNR